MVKLKIFTVEKWKNENLLVVLTVFGQQMILNWCQLTLFLLMHKDVLKFLKSDTKKKLPIV